MSYRPKKQSVSSLVEHIESQLRRVESGFAGLDLREKVRHLVEMQRRFSDLGVSILHGAGIRAAGARERIRLYLILYEGIVIDGEELQVVSGIAEFARRIRELRKEHGYQIATGASPDPESGIDLSPDQYLLVSATPDGDAARRWHVANRVRRMRAGSQQRLLCFFRENVERVVTTDELAYVAKDAKQYARRVRELRTEQGYMIATRFTGRPDLRMGQYVLESLDRVAAPHDRQVPEPIQRAVYARDDNTCVCCGWTRDTWTRSDPRILELHHIDEHAGGGPNTEANLVVLCSRCHDDVHAARLLPTLEGGAFRFRRSATGE